MSKIQEIEDLVKNIPFVLLQCRNVSALHSGHAGHDANSHFELTFQATLSGRADLLKAHQCVYAALKPIYPSQIHSIRLLFVDDLPEPLPHMRG